MIERRRGRRTPFARSTSGRWHRIVGAAGGLIFLFLAVTGVAIQHADDLRLDQRVLRAPWMLSLWGVEPSFLGIETTAGWVVTDGDAIFPPAGEKIGEHELVAAIVTQEILAISTGNQIWFMTQAGDLLDQWNEGLLPGSVSRLGISDNRLVVDTDAGFYLADADLLELSSISQPAETRWSEVPSPVPSSIYSDLRLRGAGPGLSVERILLDLHSGRAFGALGPWLMDLAALALCLVVFTGLLGWWRRWGSDRRATRTAYGSDEGRRSAEGVNPREDSRNRDRKSA